MIQSGRSTEFEIARLDEVWRKPRVMDYVHDLSWSADGNFIACSDAKGYVSIRSTITGELLRHWRAHDLTGKAQFADKARFLATAGQDGKAHIYDALSWERLAIIEHDSAWVEHLSWQGDGNRVLTGAGRDLRLSGCDGKLIRQFHGHKSTIQDVKWHPTLPDHFASCSYGGVNLWAAVQSDRQMFLECQGSVLKIAYSPNGQVIAAGCQDGVVHAWHIAGGDRVTMGGYTTKVSLLSWDETARLLATAGGAQVVVWDFSDREPSGNQPIVLSGHQSFICALAFSPRDFRVATGGLDGQIIVFDLADMSGSAHICPGDSAVSKLAWRADGKQLLAAFASGTLVNFDMNYRSH